jgi:hypothetical protein
VARLVVVTALLQLKNTQKVERVGVRLVQTMTDNVDDSFRGVEDVKGTGSECASGHVDVLRGCRSALNYVMLNECRSP